MLNNTYSGVGLNLRLEYIDEIIEQKPDIAFLEIIVDNWFSKGAHHKKLEIIRELYPISFHCVGLNIGGTDTLNQNYLKKLSELTKKYSPFQISDHLCFQNHKAYHMHDLLPFPLNNHSLSNTITRVNQIQDSLGQEILIENLSYYVEYKDSCIEEIDFLNRLSHESGCFQLLDLNNIWVNELNLNINTKNYLDKINWKYIKEVHIAGPEKIDGVHIDTHGSFPSEDVIKLLKDNKDHIKNLPLIYERDNNIPSLQTLLKELISIKSYL